MASWAQESTTATTAEPFDFNHVVERARELATQSFTAPPRAMPTELSELSFDDWQKIEHRHEHWLPLGNSHVVQLEHVGMFYTAPVQLNLVQNGSVQPVAYDAASFDFAGLEFDPADLEGGSGIAGFNLREIDSEAEEWLARFLGASRFQVVGHGQAPGVAARGVAINTGNGSGEQYPWFREFWLMPTDAPDAGVVVMALLDAPGLTGAYRFQILPGDTTVAEVQAQFFFRTSIEKLGLAPLVGTWLHGSTRPARQKDYRPAVHDADGFSMALGNGEWWWRPLDNPRRLSISSYPVESLRGFGLMQRERGFEWYQDLETRFDLHPSVWVEPLEGWGPGRLELIEIPTPDDTNDNIIAFWVPDQAPEAGESRSISWRMHWTRDDRVMLPADLAWVEHTHVLRRPEGDGDGVNLELRIDFAGAGLSETGEQDPPEVVYETPEGVELVKLELLPNPVHDGWRAHAQLVRPKGVSGEIRLRLVRNHEPMSEVFAYRIADDA